ncbi:MAG: flagellar biosynthesis anti-sigma factor FlgM [Steroidobacteraceae bacterium]
MSGKISGVTNSPPASAPPNAAGTRTAVASTATSAGGGPTDSVQITDTASHLVTAEQALNDVPVISQERVSEVRATLANGTYRISPERIANQLLQFERLLPEDPADSAE